MKKITLTSSYSFDILENISGGKTKLSYRLGLYVYNYICIPMNFLPRLMYLDHWYTTENNKIL